MIDAPGIQYIDPTETVNQSSNGDASPCTSARPIKLGDFSRLFSEFLNPAQLRRDASPLPLERSSFNENFSPEQPAANTAGLTSTNLKYVSEQLLHETSKSARIKDVPTERLDTGITKYSSSCDIKSTLANEHGINTHYQTTPSSSALSTTACQYASCRCYVFGKGHRPLGQPVLLKQSQPECPRCSAQASVARLHSQSGANETASSMLEKVQLKEAKRRRLMSDIIPYRVRDAIMAEKHPNITTQGIHVFVDMSNIDIGYQRTLKWTHSLDQNTRLWPTPHLNLQFLTEILVRDRPIVALNVCCSTIPGRSEPRYVQTLRELGYHIDLRERKRIENGLASGKTSDNHRYVEDLVDETLQVRIAESVMEHFHKPGTIVLATGDAKPSVHSDGFFSYMQRALRMGWNVEVVSWRSGLSFRWTDRRWVSQWHDKFHVIELDDFLEVLSSAPK